MEFYKVVHAPDSLPDGWLLNEVTGIEDFELKKVNTQRPFSLEGTHELKIELHPDYGKEQVDFNISVTGVTIVNERFKNLLTPEEAEFIPIEIYKHNNDDNWYILRILNFYDCLDEEKSEVSFWTAENAYVKDKIGSYRSLGRYVIDESKVGTARIFRLKKYNPEIIIKEELKISIDKEKFSGISFHLIDKIVL